jgi:ferric-dicitrate binding protein FerR (iron transport regulator)
MKDQLKLILSKGNSEDANEPDRQEMLSLFHQPEKEFELKSHLLEELKTFETPDTLQTDVKLIFEQLWARIEKKDSGTRTRHINIYIRIAAALLIGLIVGFYVNSLKTTDLEPVYYAAHSPRGSISEMLLPDGSTIYLNSDSKIEYSIEANKHGTREVFLTGEAWFDVAKDKKKPFVVHTPVYDVNVTGTQFNVKAYESDNEVITTLEEGQIIIHSNNKFKLLKDVVLKPGEQVVLNKDSRELTIKEVNTKWFTSWKDNKLIFVNMELKDLVVLLERKYGVDIQVKNKDILDLHFDGTIKNESILEILEIIKKALPINYKIVGQKIEITNKN